MRRELRFHIPYEGDQREAQAFDRRQEAQQFVRLSTVRNQQDGIPPSQHPQIPVYGFCGVHEQGRSACTGESGRDLATDDPRLAHPAGDDPSPAGGECLDGTIKSLIQPSDHPLDCIGLDLKDPTSFLERTGHLEYLPGFDEAIDLLQGG